MGEATTKTRTKEEVEAEIPPAMRARVGYFKEQADSLTLEDVRRTLETDLKMEKFSLDAHKKFIKQCLDKCFSDADADDETKSKVSVEIAKETVQSVKEAASIQHEDLQRPDRMKSPALSVMEPAAGETEKSQSAGSSSDVSEEIIRTALKQKAAYIRANIEEISSLDVRRMLEEGLKLQKNTLDPYKHFIKEELEKVLSTETVEAADGVKEKPKQASQNKVTGKKSKVSKGASRDPDSLDSNDDLSEDEEIKEERKPRKRPAEKIKLSTKAVKKQKTSIEKKKSSSSRKKKAADQDSDQDSESESRNASESARSDSSAEESVKTKTEKPAQVYGKQVERLKLIIKSCGMSVPPTVYKRAKQAPEHKREAFLIKDLEDILEREGMSTNPSEKEIKAVKRKKERAKELEGIDMSNIVASSRRRSTSSYIPPPKPKIEESSDHEEDEDDRNDEEDSDDGDNDSGDSSEGSDEDADDDSD